MTILSDQLRRIQDILQDTDQSPANLALLAQAHQSALSRLARLGVFTQIVWMQAVAGQARYTLPTQVVDISYVMYNQRVLRSASEATLDRLWHGSELAQGEPQFWTMENQLPNVVRLIPPPTRTGSATPMNQPGPMVQDLTDNLVIWATEDTANQVDDETDELPTLLDWDDVLVYDTVRALAERETTVQNLPVSQLVSQLASLWERYVKRP